jgi:hypothetical protein
MESAQDEINFDEVVEAAKASLKDNDNNNNMNSEVEEYINKEKEIINNTITLLKSQDISSSHSKKSLEEILQILNNAKYTTNLTKDINLNNINDK